MKQFIVAVFISASAVPAFAQALDFSSVDADQSGTISFEELNAAVPGITEDTFKAIDADGSGELSPEEYAAIGGG